LSEWLSVKLIRFNLWHAQLHVYSTAEIDNFLFSHHYVILILHGTQSQVITALDLQMTVEMLDAPDYSFTFPHTRACSKSDRITLLSLAYRGMWLMRVAPGGASIDEGFILTRYIRPIRGSDRDDHICPFHFIHDLIHVVMKNAFCRGMTTSASCAETERIVIDADRFYGIFALQLIGYDVDDFRGCAVSYGTAIDDQ